MKKKSIIVVLLALILCFSLCACDGEEKEDSTITIQGVFKLEAEEVLALDEEIDDNLQPLLVVFDVAPLGEQNVEFESWDDSVVIQFENGNYYEQTSLDSYDSFMEYSGYLKTTESQTIWGGSEDPTRMVTLFLVNKNDLTDDYAATVFFNMATPVFCSKGISAEKTQTISLYDGIFAVEENPDLYQISRSIPRRAEIIETARFDSTFYWNSTNADGLRVNAATMVIAFADEAEWGISCGKCGELGEREVIFSENLPVYNPAALELVPEIKDSVNNLIAAIDDYADIADNPDFSDASDISAAMSTIDSEIEKIKKAYD